MKTQILTDMQVAWSCGDDYEYAVPGVTATLISLPNKGKVGRVN
jgi:hypothetical protein